MLKVCHDNINKQEWEKEGLDKVDLAEYDFYLTWPNSTNPNYIRLMDENGKYLNQNQGYF